MRGLSVAPVWRWVNDFLVILGSKRSMSHGKRVSMSRARNGKTNGD